MLDDREALYGGAGGGGKTDALLMSALQYAMVPGYTALILRKTFTDLSMPDSILSRCHDWLRDTPARWDAGRKTYFFPCDPHPPATLTFGYLQHEADKFRYRGPSFQFIAIDEVTEFAESQYTFMLSRLRRLVGVDIPPRARVASNPGGSGHLWVKERFQLPHGHPSRPFIPARLSDNPHIDRVDYERGLMDLPPVIREQILNGDWTVMEGGNLFQKRWFGIVEPHALPRMEKVVRFWDLAATDPKHADNKQHGPCYTAGVKLGLAAGQWYVLDVQRFRHAPKGVEDAIRQTAAMDGNSVPVVFEEEGGSGGKNTLDHYRRFILVGFTVDAYRPIGSKVARAGPISSAAEAGNVKLVRGRWNADFLDEVELFPSGPYKDQVDAASGALDYMRQAKGGFLVR